MATPQGVNLNPSASLVTNYLSVASLIYKDVNVPYVTSSLGRVIYFKEASELPGPSTFTITPQVDSYIQGQSALTLERNQSVTIQAYTLNNWGVLGAYKGIEVFSTQVLPGTSVIINPTMKSSQIFVDLRTDSKTIVLPPIETITSLQNSCPYYTIKDVYGFAATNALYISCSANNTLERSSINNSIKIDQNFASIDLAANAFLSKWHILNYYDGSLVSRP